LQTAILARLELGAQLLTAFIQAFVTARAIRLGGLSLTLSAVPIVSIVGFAAFGATAWGLTPLLGTFMAFYVLRRASDFSLTQPSRKILFTVLSREDKYKASSFVETSVYRLGDQLGVWVYAGLAALGLTLTGISWVAVPMSAVFLALGLWLARRQRELAG
jgi:AAA family ATP:ADP antiporter